jgi:hypothetical protein
VVGSFSSSSSSSSLCFTLQSFPVTPPRCWDGRTMYGHEDESNGRKGAKGANHMVKGGGILSWISVRIQTFEAILGRRSDGNKKRLIF